MPYDDEGDHEVGYGKPPRHSQFVKGQSGNPRGRPPGAKNLKTLLNKALNELVIVTENGGRRKVSKREAIVTQLVNRSAKADYKAIQILLGMLRDIEGNTDPHPSDAAFTEADLQIIQRIRTRLRERVNHDERAFAPRTRCDPALGPWLFRRALFLPAQPASGVPDELAHRGHRRQARRGARRQDPAVDHQPAAAPPQIIDGFDRVSGLVSGA
jgi:hypothetical protein